MIACRQASPGREYYQPTDQGFEQRLRQRMEEIRKIKSRPASGERHD